MELTNRQRKYLGLELVELGWERMEIPNSVKPRQVTGSIILYFDGDTVRKTICADWNGDYLERSVSLKTQEGRTMLAPRTERGKAYRLNAANLDRYAPYGMYFRYDRGCVMLANYTTQQTYYHSRFAGVSAIPEAELAGFLEQWIRETDEAELAKIQAFAAAKRRHCRFQEGDFFRFSVDRTHYGYGRILLDVNRMIKSGVKFWNILMGTPLVVSAYHILTEDPAVPISELEDLKSCPSQYIMDNVFYYGEYKIIGNGPLPANPDYPIQYGRRYTYEDGDRILYQRGPVCREIPLRGNTLPPGDFRNNALGWTLNLDKNVLEACIRENSNAPYWAQPEHGKLDLRNPKYAKELALVLEQMGVGEER